MNTTVEASHIPPYEIIAKQHERKDEPADGDAVGKIEGLSVDWAVATLADGLRRRRS